MPKTRLRGTPLEHAQNSVEQFEYSIRHSRKVQLALQSRSCQDAFEHLESATYAHGLAKAEYRHAPGVGPALQLRRAAEAARRKARDGFFAQCVRK